MFGEMVAVWIVTEWMKQGRIDTGIQIVELGPGRGTLMDDVLRSLRAFPPLNDAIEVVHMVETSPQLRNAQKSLLCMDGEGDAVLPLEQSSFTGTSKYSSIPVIWHDSLDKVPKRAAATPFILAHEFFDALPIHAFEATKSGWRELMVAHNPPSVLSVEQGNSNVNSLPEFSLTRAPRVTPHSLLLPEASSRYKALKEKEGSIIEISSDSLTIVENITSRISNSQRGAALIIDYGPSDTIPINSLRAIRSHRHVSPFYRPGDCDLSVDVDFRALAEHAITTYEDVEVHGPIEQGTFLTLLGIKQRMDAIAAVTQNEEKKKLIEKGYNRLIERGGGSMGKIYKAMAIVPERGGQKPVGFGGDLEPLE